MAIYAQSVLSSTEFMDEVDWTQLKEKKKLINNVEVCRP